jgi:hypothetical protein
VTEAPRKFVDDALKAHDDGFRLIAHWFNCHPVLIRANIKIEPCSPPPGATIAGCRNVLSNVLLGIRPHAPQIPKDDRDVIPWTLGCLCKTKDQHHPVRVYSGDDFETVEGEIDRLVSVYDSYGWTAEDWRIYVKLFIEDYGDRWRNFMSSLAEHTEETGPAGVDSFYWDGTRYHGLTPKPFLLVSALWAARHRTLSTAQAELAVYGSVDAAPEYGLTTLRREANAFFCPRIPLKIAFRGDKVALLDHHWQRAKKPARRP